MTLASPKPFNLASTAAILQLCSCTGVTDEGLQHLSLLPSLTRLYVDSRSIGDQGVKHLGPLTNLKHLDLFGAKVSDDGCAHIR